MHPTAAQIAAAREELAALDPALARAHAEAPPRAWIASERGFKGLVSQIVGQQVSVAAADAILKRLIGGVGGTLTADVVLATEETQLRAFGLSGQKARYVRAIAEAADLFDQIDDLSDEEAVKRLTAIKGVGRWTAETYLMFAEGRLDLFPAGDLALQEGLRLIEGGETRLSEKALYVRAESWRPHRGVAALLLWSYYTHKRQRPTEATKLA